MLLHTHFCYSEKNSPFAEASLVYSFHDFLQLMTIGLVPSDLLHLIINLSILYTFSHKYPIFHFNMQTNKIILSHINLYAAS